MITEIEITNYKSIKHLLLDLGRVNVFIGENGAGKSNILEAIALGCAASVDKLDNEFLAARGIRVTNPEWMRAGFPGWNKAAPIKVRIKEPQIDQVYEITNDNTPYSNWACKENFLNFLRRYAFASLKKHGISSHDLSQEYPNFNDAEKQKINEVSLQLGNVGSQILKKINSFFIYSPENTALRTFQKEGQIQPLGINGEGLLKLLAVHASDENSTVVAQVKAQMQLLGWLDDLQIKADSLFSRVEVRDRYLDEGLPWLDHRSANEGFFFLLFYFTLFCSDLTPKFFAIDNVDASLNPKLCEKLTLELVKLAKANDKQCLLTTHNPAVLDGLNLEDDEQRLFAISRNGDGETMVTRVHKPKTIAGQRPARLSELFLRGALGGLPKGF